MIVRLLFLLSALLPAAFADGDKPSIYPPQLCSVFPKVDMTAAMMESLVRRAPEIAAAPMVEFTAQAAKEALDKAVAEKLSALFIFTAPELRGDCGILISGQTLRMVDERYELHLMTPLAGVDTRGYAYRAQWIVMGRGEIVIAYDRDHIKFRHPLCGRKFHMESFVRESTPFFGALDIEGLRGPFGFTVHSLRAASDDTVGVRIGPRTITRPLRPVEFKSAGTP